MKVGVLGLQGDVREHVTALERSGAAPIIVKTVAELADVDGLVIPGGESTTIGKLLDRFGLLEPLRERAASGLPLYGTCAGAILMAVDIEGPDEAAHRIPVLDVTVRRNAYGRQVESFETDLGVRDMDDPFRGVFIRAPVILRVGAEVEVLAELDGAPVLVRQGRRMASTFHPEMTGDDRVHRRFVELIES